MPGMVYDMTTNSAPPTGLYARILTSADDKGAVYVFDSGREIYNFTVPAVYANDLDEIAIGARMHGWSFTGAPELVGPGQYFVRVGRLPLDR